MTPLTAVLAVAVGTYAIRISFIAAHGVLGAVPPRVSRALALIAPAVMAALVVQTLLIAGDSIRPPGRWHAAALVAAVVARYRSSGWALAAGLVAVWTFAALA